MRQVYEKVKNIVINPWYAMFFMLIISYFSLCRFFYNGLSPFRKVILIWGIFLLCYGSVKKRYVLKNKYSILLFAFCVSNGITVLISDKERFMYGIVTLAYVCIFTLVFFNTLRWNDLNEEQTQKLTQKILYLNVILPMIFGIIALVMYCFNVKGAYKSGGEVIYYGISDNRLWGMYNANTATTVSLISIACSLALLEQNKYKKTLISNIVIQIIYIILTQGRGGWLLFICFSAMSLVFLYILPISKNEKGKKKKGQSIVISIGILICLVCTPMVAKKVLIKVPQTVTMVMETAFPQLSEKIGIDKEVSLDRIDEEFLEEQDVSNGRVEIWKAGLQIVKDNLLFGIGSENVITQAKAYLSKERYANVKKGGFHNSYITILVSSGIIGVGVFLIFLLMIIIDGFRYLFTKEKNKYSILIILLFTLMANELLEARWLYNTSYLNIIFWVFAGIVTYVYEKELRAEK